MLGTNRMWAVALLGLAVAGCSGDTSFSARNEDIARAYCDFIFDCVDEGDPDLVFQVAMIGTRERCVGFFASQLGGRREQAIEQAIRDGSIVYDARAARECASAIRRADTCMSEALGVIFTSTRSCDEILQGQIAVGQACAFDEQCVRGASCSVPVASCGGTCASDGSPTTFATVPAGGACMDEKECLDGLYCYDGLCRAIVFQQTGAVGAECVQLVETSTTVTVVSCTRGLGCVEDPDSGDDLCAERLALGATCERGDTCVAGSLCIEDVGDTGTYTCKEYVTVRRVGDTCNVDPFDEGPQRICDHGRGLYCSAAGTCAALGDGSRDSACRTPDTIEDENIVFCKRGLYCDDDTDTCQPLRAAGAVCEDDEQCESGACNAGGTCEATYAECRGGFVF